MAAGYAISMPSGKIGHHPGWKPLQGSAAIMSQAGLQASKQARAGLPAPRTRDEVRDMSSRAPVSVCGAGCAFFFLQAGLLS